MNPNDAGRHGVGNPDSSAAGKKGFSSPYIALYPSSGLLGTFRVSSAELWSNIIHQDGPTVLKCQSIKRATGMFHMEAYLRQVNKILILRPNLMTFFLQFNPPQAGIPVLQSFPQGFVGFGNHQGASIPLITFLGYPNFHAPILAAAPDRRKTNRTPVACVVCHKAKSTCDRSRPCARCRRLGKSHLCKDRPHRKKGRPRKRLLNSDGSTTDKNAKAPEKKTRSSDPTSSSDAQKQDFKLSDCYLGNEIPQFISKKQSGRGKVDRTGDPPGQKSAKGPQADAPLTELQNSFAQMSHATNNTLWEEIIGDMSSFIDDT
eukprot:1167195-Amorphochlora_amoeboformis.AAC.2